MGTVDIFVGNNLIIDFDVYTNWVNGYSVEECKEVLIKKEFSNRRDVFENIILKDINDYYHVFNKLEQYLQSPTRLKEQLLFQITDDEADRLIEKYYQYDTIIIREILGHKLSQRQRKDLDDICEKYGFRVKSCRRQFDNLKRITRLVEDMKGSLLKNIMENFCLPIKTAEQYAAIVFLTKNQFEISKKKLNHLLLDDFIFCANQMIKNWSAGSSNEYEADFSKDFLINLKDLKIITERDYIDDHRKLVISSIGKTINNLSNRDYKSKISVFDSLFKDLSKALIDIAYALNHSKDMKEIFVDLVERFIEPCQDENLSKNEIKLFLDEYRKRAHQLHNVCRDNPNCLNVFDRYMLTITNCIMQMYHT